MATENSTKTTKNSTSATTSTGISTKDTGKAVPYLNAECPNMATENSTKTTENSISATTSTGISSKDTGKAVPYLNALVVGEIDKRKGFFQIDILPMGQEKIHTLHVNGQPERKFKNKDFILLINATIFSDGVIRVDTCRKILTGKSFRFEESTVRNYLTPKVVSVHYALNASVRDRLCVGAMVTRVSEVFETPKSTRRLITLSDTETKEKIVLKLWNQKTEIKPTVGDMALFKNVRVGEYEKNKDLNSCYDTTMCDFGTEEEIIGEIIGGFAEGDTASVFLNGNQYSLSISLYKEIFSGEDFREGVFVLAIAKGNKILHMKSIDQEEPKKKKLRTK